MKKCLIIVLAIFLFIFSSSCDMHSGKRPYDYPPAIWVSEDPIMWFEIGKSDNSAYVPIEKIFGYLILDGHNIEIEVFFDYGNGVYFNEKNDALDRPTTRGRCTFSKDKLVVKIDKKRDFFLNGLYETIEFIRVPKWIFNIILETGRQ